MQAVKVSWVGQTFALAKCSDSGGKKPRSRRTKEERKTMVESFIKKYQTLNNGSFPSLNLTHKEVGGSFYTVREIFQEIIQENRVLDPASSSSEEQSIESFSGEFALELQSSKHQSPLSLSSTFRHTVDQKQKDIILLSNGQYSIGEELFTASSGESVEKCQEMDEYKEEKILLSDSNDICISQHKHGESNNDLQQNFDNDHFLSQKYIGENDEGEERQPSQPGQIKMQEDKLIHAEPDISERREVAENLVGAPAATVSSVLYSNEFHSCKDETQLQQNNGAPVTVNDTRPSDGLDPQKHGGVIDQDVGKESDSKAAAVNSIVDGGTVSKTEVNVETSKLSPTVYVGEATPLTPVAAPSCGPNGRPEDVQDSGALQVRETHLFPKEMEVAFLHVNSSSTLSGEDTPESLSDDIVDKKARVKTANLGLEVDVSNSNASTPQTLDQSQLFKRVEIEKVSDTSNNGGESLAPEIKDVNELEAEDEVIIKSSTRSGTSSSSVLDGASSDSSGKATEESAKAETNPFFAIIKSFVTAFVKFWVE